MRLGEKDSQALLNTNRKVFGYIPDVLTSYEIGKLKKLIHRSYRNKEAKERQKSREDVLDDLFEGLVVDQTIGCWYLEGKWDKYREVRINKNKIIAHRLSYEIFIDAIILPFVCHHCDRPGCCNPWHLFNGTHTNNMEDARLKGRWNKPKKLTAAEKFLLWKHINTSSNNKPYDTFKIND